MIRKYAVLSSALLSLMCGACGYHQVSTEQLKEEGAYWQRSDVTEASYMEGPKEQQMLHRDISRCVTELREMDRLGALRNALPGETSDTGGVPDPNTPQGKLDQWDTPERDAYLLAEHTDYDDFETCMQAKGWERMEHVPYDVAQKSRQNYLEAVEHQKYRTSIGEGLPDPAPTPPEEAEPSKYGYARN